MKRFGTLILAACLLAALAGCSSAFPAAPTASSLPASSAVSAAEPALFAGGSGTQADPYQVATAEQLAAFRDSVNDGSQGGYAGQYIRLAADLDLAGADWTPIGTMEDMETYSTLFLGTFDGGGHTISGLTYRSDAYNCGAGLFGVSTGTIQNLVVEDVTVEVTEGTSLAIGGVVGYNMGALDHVTVRGARITGNNCTGGLAGGNNGSVTNCAAEDVTVTVLGDNDFSAGLVQDDIAECGGLLIGGSFGGSINGCTASGTVRAAGNEPVGLGGIGGCLEMMDSITNCTAAVTIESARGGHAIGGLCGYAGTHSDPDVCRETEGFSTSQYPCIVENCTVDVTIRAAGATHVGGLIGTGLYYYGEETAFGVTNCRVTGAIDGAVTPGAIAGRAEGSTIENCTWDVRIDGEPAAGAVGETDRMYESADQ